MFSFKYAEKFRQTFEKAGRLGISQIRNSILLKIKVSVKNHEKF